MTYSDNKNKKHQQLLKITGLSIVIASFLLMPSYSLLAEEAVNANTAETTENSGSTESLSNSENNTTETNDELTNEQKAQELELLNQQLEETRKKIEELNEKSEIYQKNIKVKQQEAITLENQMALIDLQVEQTKLDIETVSEEMAKVNLEVKELEVSIGEKNVELEYRKEVMADFLRLINKNDQKSELELLVTQSSFSDFFNDFKYTEDLQEDIKNALDSLKAAKAELEGKLSEREAKKVELDDLSVKLASSIVNLNNQKEYKADLLVDTKESEEKFELLLQEAKREQEAAQAEIGALESRARQRLEEGGVDLNIEAVLMWPVSPTKGISAFFHDPDYPYRKYFEHPAIDIPRSQGSNIRAAESGYVARAKNGGMGYSYIMLVHNEELSTVYGHVSRIDVAEDDYVVRGQVIGAVGGIPGTPGAGRLTTGAHLHFEVRSNGIPVNPLDYLPAL